MQKLLSDDLDWLFQGGGESIARGRSVGEGGECPPSLNKTQHYTYFPLFPLDVTVR